MTYNRRSLNDDREGGAMGEEAVNKLNGISFFLSSSDEFRQSESINYFLSASNNSFRLWGRKIGKST